MEERPGHDAPLIQWAMAARPLQGSPVCGDQAVVAELPHQVLVAVVDGLGHGAAAAEAAATAVSVLERHAHEAIAALVERCHAALVGTRGATLSLAALSPQHETLTWLAVGNVAGTLLRADRRARPRYECLTLRGGIVGVRLPPLRPAVLPIGPDDTLVIATDGLRADWPDGLRSGDPLRLTEQLMARYGTTTDDALVLAARYRGKAA